MKINFSSSSFQDCITGKLFDNNCQIFFDLDLKVRNRDIVLKELTKNRKIIHVGCADHLEIIREKIKSGTWLHSILVDSAKKCIGIDIKREAVQYLQQYFHIPNLICGDITQDIDEIKSENWDIILIPEVLEHISNPVSFLSSIKSKHEDYINSVIITVPNVFALPQYKYASRNIELINTDHRFWFSPYTIIKVINDAGLKLENIFLVNGFWGPFYYNLSQRLINRILWLINVKRDYKKIQDLRFARGLLIQARFR